jgi:hypothetical protein
MVLALAAGLDVGFIVSTLGDRKETSYDDKEEFETSTSKA